MLVCIYMCGRVGVGEQNCARGGDYFQFVVATFFKSPFSKHGKTLLPMKDPTKTSADRECKVNL